VIPQSCLQAYVDRRLVRSDLRVWKHALECLSFYHPRPFKVRSVSRATGMRFQHVAVSIRRLTEAGYFERGNLPTTQIHTYLLRTTVPTKG